MRPAHAIRKNGNIIKGVLFLSIFCLMDIYIFFHQKRKYYCKTTATNVLLPLTPFTNAIWNCLKFYFTALNKWLYSIFTLYLHVLILSWSGVCVSFCVLFWSPCVVCLPVIVCPGQGCQVCVTKPAQWPIKTSPKPAQWPIKPAQKPAQYQN